MKSKSEVETDQIKTYLKKLYQDILDEMELFTFKHKKPKSSPFAQSFQKPLETLKSKPFFEKPLKRSMVSSRFSSLGVSNASSPFLKNTKDTLPKERDLGLFKNSDKFTYEEFIFDKSPALKPSFKRFDESIEKLDYISMISPQKSAEISKSKLSETIKEKECVSPLEEESLLTPLAGNFEEEAEKNLFQLLQKEKEGVKENEKKEVLLNNTLSSKKENLQESVFKTQEDYNQDPFWEDMEETFNLKESETSPAELKESTTSQEVKKVSHMPFGLFSSHTGSLTWAGEIKWYLIAKKSRDDFKKSLPKGFCLCDGLAIENNQSRLQAKSSKVIGKAPLWIEEYDKDHEVVGVIRVEES